MITVKNIFQACDVRGGSKSRGGGGAEENGGWVSKFRALAKGGSPQFSASGGVGHYSF